MLALAAGVGALCVALGILAFLPLARRVAWLAAFTVAVARAKTGLVTSGALIFSLESRKNYSILTV